VIVSGNLADEFALERGLRQGDPLSPFLFMLAVERLNIMMNAIVEAEMLSGYKVGREEAISITHF